MEELIEYCTKHFYNISFNLNDDKLKIEFTMNDKNYHILSLLVDDLKYMYLDVFNYYIKYEKTSGIKLVLVPPKNIDRNELYKNIKKALEEIIEITFPELENQLAYRMFKYLRKFDIPKALFIPTTEDDYSLIIYRRKRTVLPDIIRKNPELISTRMNNYVKDFIPILEYRNLQEIIDEFYPKPQPEKVSLLKLLLNK